MKHILLLVLLCCGGVVTQDKAKLPDDIESKYDRFRDSTVIHTKAITAFAMVGKEHFTCSMLAVTVSNGKTGGEYLGLFLYITPDALTGLAKFSQSMHTPNRVYFSPNADVIALVDGERVKLDRAQKDFGFTGAGDPKSAVIIEISPEILKKIGQSKMWEIAVGDVEISFPERYARRINPRLVSLAEIARTAKAKSENAK